MAGTNPLLFESIMQVALHTPATIYSLRHIPSWILLAGAAGYVNGFAYLACQQFVTHVTGTVTQMGLEYSHEGIAADFAVIYISFVVGAISAVLLVRARAKEGSRDRWALPLIIVALIIAGVAVAGNNQAFKPFGTITANDTPPVVLLSLLAFAAGLQNAAVASTTGMAVRTTHLTGPTTDIGMLLGAAILGGRAERRAALRGAGLRSGMVLAFLIGAALAVSLSAQLGYLALLVASGAVLIAAGLSFVPHWNSPDLPFREKESDTAPEGTAAGLPSDAKPQPEDHEED